MSTLKEIANECGFSVATISRVLNRDETLNVPQSTREIIFDTAEKLNYKTKFERKQGSLPVDELLYPGEPGVSENERPLSGSPRGGERNEE